MLAQLEGKYHDKHPGGRVANPALNADAHIARVHRKPQPPQILPPVSSTKSNELVLVTVKFSVTALPSMIVRPERQDSSSRHQREQNRRARRPRRVMPKKEHLPPGQRTRAGTVAECRWFKGIGQFKYQKLAGTAESHEFRASRESRNPRLPTPTLSTLSRLLKETAFRSNLLPHTQRFHFGQRLRRGGRVDATG